MRTGSRKREIEFQDVSKRFQLAEGYSLREFLPMFFKKKGFQDAFYALRNVSFSIDAGEVVGIVGRNGSGKSTILKLIAGVTAPSEGEVHVMGRVSPLIELGAGFHPDLTGRENIQMNASILGMTARETRERFDDMVAFAELEEFVDTPVKRYSSGMYMRLGFSVAIHSNPEILLIDEVLSVGDAYFQAKCLAKMDEFKRSGVTIIVVSHSMDLMTDFCDRVLVIEAGRITGEGAPAEMIEQYLSTASHSAESAPS